MGKPTLVKESDLQAHKDKPWQVAHNIWPNAKAYSYEPLSLTL